MVSTLKVPTTVRLIILVVLVFSTGGTRVTRLGTLTSAQPLGYFTLVVVRKYDGMIPGCLLGLCTIRYTPGYSQVIDSPYFSSDSCNSVPSSGHGSGIVPNPMGSRSRLSPLRCGSYSLVMPLIWCWYRYLRHPNSSSYLIGR